MISTNYARPESFARPAGHGLAWRTALLAATSALALSVFPAQAQDAQGAQADDAFLLEEIVVTAQRRVQSLREVPISITAFSADAIERNNIKDLTDYFNKTPNVSFVDSGTRGERDISIRGVSNIGGQVSALAFYVDEFNIVNGPAGSNTFNSSINPQLQDVERIEVLRGPQGTFFGRNATGGAINITMKKPGPDLHAEATADFGRFDTFSIGGVANIPLAENRLFFRTSAYFEKSDGAIKNVNPVGGDSGTEFTNARAALRWLANERITIDLTANYTEEKQGVAELIGTGVLTGGSAGLAGAAGFSSAIGDGLGFYPQNQRRINNDLKSKQRNRFTTLVARTEIEADDFTVTTVFGIFDARHTFDKDLDFTSFGFLKFDNFDNSHSFSLEARVSSNGDGPIDWLVGGIYAEDKLDQFFRVLSGPDMLLGLPDNFPIDIGDLKFRTKSFAFFGDATWHVDDRWAVTVGGRYSEDDVSQSVGGVNFGTPDVPGRGKVDFSDFSPRFAVTWDLNEEITLYGTVSKGFKAGGLQLNVTQQLPVVDFAEENLWNYEGGLKAVMMDGRLQTNLSIFWMDWQDLQVSTNVAILDENNEITFINTTTNAAGATNAGVEFDFRALVAEGLEFSGGIGYLDAKFDKFPDALVQGVPVDLSGKRIPRAPKWTLNADAQYTVPLEQAGDLFVRAEWSYRSQSFPTIDSLLQTGFPFRAPAFDLWNIRAGFGNDRFRISAFVENLFNEEYFTTTQGFGFSGIKIHPAYRTWGIRFSTQFN